MTGKVFRHFCIRGRNRSEVGVFYTQHGRARTWRPVECHVRANRERKRRQIKEQCTYLTEVRDLDSLGTLLLTGSGNLYASTFVPESDIAMVPVEQVDSGGGSRRRNARSAHDSLASESLTHVGPVGSSLSVDGNSSNERSESSDESLGCHRE